MRNKFKRKTTENQEKRFIEAVRDIKGMWREIKMKVGDDEGEVQTSIVDDNKVLRGFIKKNILSIFQMGGRGAFQIFFFRREILKSGDILELF